MKPQVNRRIKKLLWSDDDKRYLLKAAGVLPEETIAHNLGRSVEAIRKQATKSGISLRIKENDGQA